MAHRHRPPVTVDLDPYVWRLLPRYIFEKIIARLPFEDILRLRGICKAWNRVILSMPYGPNNPKPKQILLCSPRGGGLNLITSNLTENIRGEWFPLHLDRLLGATGGLCLVAAGIGLLCFCTRNAGRLILFNPISKTCRRLPPAIVSNRVNPQTNFKRMFSTRGLNAETLFREHGHESSARLDVPELTGDAMVTLITYRHAGDFRVVIAAREDNHQTLQVYDSQSTAWRMVRHESITARLKFDCNMVSSDDVLYFIEDDNPRDSSVAWHVVAYHLGENTCYEVTPPLQLLDTRDGPPERQFLSTTQRPQLLILHGRLWLIVEGFLNCSICFWKLDVAGMSWQLMKEISSNLYYGTMAVLYKCVALQWVVYLRVFDALDDGSVQLVMLVHDLSSNNWTFLNDPEGLDGRYFLYDSFVFEPSLHVMP
ncbi:hypothetical protein R1flu_020167 [Riccia fluitans]|uniref:F-box domain-containing protein n=1 Tax=Riccia fluitans TaxID=41844 RepID=A0ABD1ZPL0_9MARC